MCKNNNGDNYENADDTETHLRHYSIFNQCSLLYPRF